MMRIIALISILCIGFLAWYSYPNPPPEADSQSQSPAPAPAPAKSIANKAEPERVAVIEDRSSAFERSPDAEGFETIFDVMRVQNDDYLAVVPDLRFYLDPQAIELMRGLSEAELVDKINNERSAEAAYWLALHYQEDEQTYVMLMLSAASYAKKPGPLFEAINGCCSYSLDDPDSIRAANIKREALVMIARELNLPDAEGWPEFELDPDIEAEVFAQRAAYIEEINQYSMEAFGEGWVK
jgi:hypothetical protein